MSQTETRPRALDLFCGAGGMTRGLQQAGFHVTGVDIELQPHYVGDEFAQADALLQPFWPLDQFDLIHASPPCQHFTKYRNVVKDITDRYEDLVAPTRQLLEASGVPYVIENVPGAPIHPDLVLCGSMFGLDVRRHRWFELGGWDAMGPGGCNHKGWARRFKSSTGRTRKRYTIEVGAWDEPLELQKECMGVDWTVTVRELSEMVPPAYAKFIGEAFLNRLVGSDTRKEGNMSARTSRPLLPLEQAEWETKPWCLNGWAGADDSDHIHYCRYDYGHLGRCVCEWCRSWTLETPPNAYPIKVS